MGFDWIKTSEDYLKVRKTLSDNLMLVLSKKNPILIYKYQGQLQGLHEWGITKGWQCYGKAKDLERDQTRESTNN
jgi:hypothetical protein